MTTVLVTGANGHLGGELVRRLNARGYRVRASVRDLAAARRDRRLSSAAAELVQADITMPETLPAAVAGVDAVFQVAAIYTFDPASSFRRLLETNVQGALNVARAAVAAGVRRLIYTSSIGAVGYARRGAPARTEDDWNESPADPYTRAKTEAERRMWALAEERGLDMVSVIPSVIIGPGFQRHTPSTQLFDHLLARRLLVSLPLVFNYVDVRDVADAHILALETVRARGRYLATGQSLSLTELHQLACRLEPSIPPPKLTLPLSLLPLAPAIDWGVSKLFRAPRLSNRGFIEDIAGREQCFSHRRAREELNWSPRPIAESIADTIAWLKRGADTAVAAAAVADPEPRSHP
jgi:dihydroflavonol-4-reductase